MGRSKLTVQEQLIALFAGEVCEGEWLTRPFYDPGLALEIARNCDPGSEASLRKAIFGVARPADSVPNEALLVIAAAFDRWRRIRLQQGARGL